MIVHFICRGNVFRSLIAETYLKSLQLPGVTTLSSGAVADEYRAANIEQGFAENTRELLTKHGLTAYIKTEDAEQLTQERLSPGQLVIFANDIAFNEAMEIIRLPEPESAIKWNIVDIGEGSRIANSPAERVAFEEEIFAEITNKVDELVVEKNLANG